MPPPAIRVLVVDDEEGIRRFEARALGDHGYDVTTAGSGSEALQIIDHDAPFDVVVTDVAMPEMTGVELGAALRARDPDIPILYFTGYADRVFDDKGTLWANEAFLEKPVSMSALLEAVSLVVFGHTHGPKA